MGSSNASLRGSYQKQKVIGKGLTAQKSAETIGLLGEATKESSGVKFSALLGDNLQKGGDFAEDMVVLGDMNNESRSVATAQERFRQSRRSLSMGTFNTLGSGYTVPKRDHAYHIKHAFRMGEGPEGQ